MAVKLPYPFPNVDDLEWSTWALWYNLDYLAKAITRTQTGQLVPSGSILLLNSGSTCPDGYTKITTGIGNRYLRLTSGAAGTTGGSLVGVVTDAGHTHVSNTTSFASSTPSSTTLVTAGAVSVSSGTHTHTVNPPATTSASSATGITVTTTPPFMSFILCAKT